jgi:hypothetical protein
MDKIEKYGDWELLEFVGRKRLSRCKCGVVKSVNFYDVRAGKSKGCGCETKKKLAERSKIVNRRHGFSDTPTQGSWVEMRRRCYATHRKEYPNYGGRGITVCDRWLESFDNFLADMGPKPEGYTIERVNNNGNYTPENCKWVPRPVQERNKRTNARYNFNGESLLVVEAAEVYGIKAATLYNRINTLKWEPSRAVNEPVHNN